MSQPGGSDRWDELSKQAEDMMKNAIFWTCPACKHDNVDLPEHAATPNCCHCGEMFSDWGKVEQ